MALLLWWGISWATHGGWPASGPVGAALPPHITFVTPADGERVAGSNGFCVHLYYFADHGLPDEPEQVIRYYLDGWNVTGDTVDTTKLEYGYPVSDGEPCYRQAGPLKPGWHTAQVRYIDNVGERITHTWRFEVVGEE